MTTAVKGPRTEPMGGTTKAAWCRARTRLASGSLNAGGLSLAMGCAALGWTHAASAGNTDEVLIGSEAALTSGAVTAHVSSGSSLYYNPAGLANVTHHELNLNATAVSYSSTRISGAVQGPDDLSEATTISEFLIIPSDVSFLLRLGEGLTAGIGMFAVEAVGEELRTGVEFPGDSPTNWRLYYQDNGVSYRLGPGIGWNPVPGLNVGASLLAVYDSYTWIDQFSGTEYLPDGTDLFLTESTSDSFFGLGGQAVLGVQWTPTPLLTVGAALQTPTYDITTSTKLEILDAAAFEDEDTGEILTFTDSSSEHYNDSFSGVFIPLRVRLGVALNTGEGWVSLDGDYQPALPSMDRQEQWNVRVGTLQQLSELLWIGGGLFTDRTIEEEIDGIGGIDYYGGTVGLRFGKERRLHPDEKYQGMTSTTTLALRYAYGSGDALGLYVEPFDGGVGMDTAGYVAAEAHVHEIAITVGSSVAF